MINLFLCQRDVPSAEVVMMNRIFLADEKALLLQEKQSVLEGTYKSLRSSTNESGFSVIAIVQLQMQRSLPKRLKQLLTK